MSKSPIGLGAGASSRPTRASRRDEAARVVAEVPEVEVPADDVEQVASPALAIVPTATPETVSHPSDSETTETIETSEGEPAPVDSPAPIEISAEASLTPVPVSASEPEPVTPEERPITASDLLAPRKKPDKKPLSTYITSQTSARLERFVKEGDYKTTDVVDLALTRLFDELGFPSAGGVRDPLIES